MERNNKVSKTDMATLPRIIAVDFDGCLVSDKYPGIGQINHDVWEALFAKIQHGNKVILWSCRTGAELNKAVAFCSAHGLHFDAVNDNLPEVIAMFGGNARKVYATEYWDDKAIKMDSSYRGEISKLRESLSLPKEVKVF